MVTTGMFGSMTFYGYTTKKNLDSWGAFLGMGLIGLIIAMVVHIFVGGAMMGFLISCCAVVIFTGLTAWDVQQIKKGEIPGAKNAPIFGALMLYLDFINMFIHMMRLMSGNYSND